MRAEQLDLSTPRMQVAIEELQQLIQQHYPEATFQVEPGDDPTGMYVLGRSMSRIRMWSSRCTLTAC